MSLKKSKTKNEVKFVRDSEQILLEKKQKINELEQDIVSEFKLEASKESNADSTR